MFSRDRIRGGEDGLASSRRRRIGDRGRKRRAALELAPDVLDLEARVLLSLPGLTQLVGAANPFDGLAVEYKSAPTLVDLDRDGDLDLVSGADDGGLHYFENTGNATAPSFVERSGAANPLDGLSTGGF